MPRMCAREIDQAFADEPSLDNGQPQEEILDDEYENFYDYLSETDTQPNPDRWRDAEDDLHWEYNDAVAMDRYYDCMDFEADLVFAGEE